MEEIKHNNILFKQFRDTPYFVSSCGKILRKYKNHIRYLKPTLNVYGYFYCSISIKCKVKKHLLHRLIGEVWINNPNNKPCINHKDGNTENNHINNLEWCTHSENLKHSYRELNRINPMQDKKGILCPNSIKIAQYDLDGILLQIWDSITEAAEILNVNRRTISQVAKGKRKSTGGYKWKYI